MKEKKKNRILNNELLSTDVCKYAKIQVICKKDGSEFILYRSILILQERNFKWINECGWRLVFFIIHLVIVCNCKCLFICCCCCFKLLFAFVCLLFCVCLHLSSDKDKFDLGPRNFLENPLKRREKDLEELEKISIIRRLFVQIQLYGMARRPLRNHQVYWGGRLGGQYICN